MRVMVLLLALSCAFTSATALSAATFPAVTNPQSAANHKPQATTLGTESITIPQMLSYQGKLTDTLGVPVSDTTYQVTFRLYTVPTGGASFWNETQTVRTRNGLFSTLVGSVAPIESVPSSGSLYLGMAVAGGAELSPRLRLVGSAYSYLAGKSANSDLLQGKDSTGFVRTGQVGSVTSSMLVDGTIAAADLGQMGASSGQVMKWNGSAWVPANDSIGGGGGGGDNAWVRNGSDSVLYTVHQLGVARGGAGNTLYGNQAFTHVNLGVACTTGTSGQNCNYSTAGVSPEFGHHSS